MAKKDGRKSPARHRAEPQAQPPALPSSAPVPEMMRPQSLGAAADSDAMRAAREIETAMIVAKRFPRDQVRARDQIAAMCARPVLAESATYSYKRGTTIVEGASIRLAEAIAQAWGNVEFGVRELSQHEGWSVVQSYAFDIETNSRSTKTFSVPHVRYTREDGLIELTDPRDIYEAVANQAARRLRACILAIIPGDVIDEALHVCNRTLEQQGSQPEQMKALVKAFAGYNVSVDMLVRRLGHSLDAAKPAEIIQLRKVYAALRDGMTNTEAEFPSQGSGPRPKTAADAAAQGANKPKTFEEFEKVVLKTQPGSELQAVLDDAKAALSADEHKRLKGIAEKIHGGDA